MVKLKKVLVTNLWQALLLRVIRNECRKFMTRDKQKIGFVAQIDWFLFKYMNRHDIGKLHCYLFYYDNKPVGYGVVRFDRYGNWLSGGLKKAYRGLGLGTELFQSLVNEWEHLPLDLEVLTTNLVGQKVYKKLGFIETAIQGRPNTIRMQRKAITHAK